jgi:DNA polymerase-4
MRPEAAILHADLDAFYASVEQRDDPRLRGRPVIVGAGVVLAASYEAKAYGVRTAMGGGQARRLCPHAAVRLRRRVLEEVGLPITVGVARSKFLAKVASGVAKPDGLLLVPPEHELAFLHPLPVERLWGVGAVTAAKLRARGIETVRQVARLDEATLVSMLGPASGRHLHALAHNRDPRPVQVGRRRRSIGSQHALGRSGRAPEAVDASLMAVVDRVTRRMRAAGRVGRTVTLRLRFDDFSRATRSDTLPQATAQTDLILAAARALLGAARPMIERRGITLVGVAVSNLDGADAVQLALPFGRTLGQRPPTLDEAVDRVRERFGTAAVTRAVLLGRDTGFTVPLLPD